MRKEFTIQSRMFIVGEEPRRQSRSSFPVSASRSIRFGTTLTSETLHSVSEDSVLQLSILKEVWILEHSTEVYLQGEVRGQGS